MNRILLLLLLIFATSSQADMLLTVQPWTDTVQVGDVLAAGIDISGLDSTASLAMYNLTLAFDASLLQYDHMTFGDPVLGSQLDLSYLGLSSTVETLGTGWVNLSEFSLDDTTILVGQAKQFTLATVYWNTIAQGSSPLQLTVNGLWDGNASLLSASPAHATVEITAVPLPAVLWLFVCGLPLLFRKAFLLPLQRLVQVGCVLLLGLSWNQQAQACSLQFTSPARGSTVTSSQIGVSGSGTGNANTGDQGQVTAYLNGVPFFNQSGTFTTLINFLGSGAASVTLQKGANTLSVSGSVNGCSASDSMVVFYQPPPAQEQKNAGAPLTCNGTNPVNDANGNKFQQEADYQGVGEFPLQLVRYYNSAYSDVRSLGKSWRHGYERELSFDSGKTNAYIIRPDGKAYRFTKSGGTWVSDGDINDRFITLSNSASVIIGWRLFRGDDNSFEYFDSTGRLITWVDQQGLSQDISYDMAGRISAVTDRASQRALSFAYDSKNRLIAVTDPAGGIYAYSYDSSGRLAQVTRPDALPNTPSRQYLYNEPANTSAANLPYALTGILDENGDRYATYRYDVQGRGIATEHADGSDLHQLSYNADGSTRITDALGHQRTYRYQTILGVKRSSGQDQPAGSGCAAAASQIGYDANGNRDSDIDFNGHKTTYSYDSTRNLETRRTEGLTGNGDATGVTRTIATAWHGSWNLPVAVSEYAGAAASGTPTRQTGFSYDDKGNLTQITESDPVSNRQRTTAITYTYSSAMPGLVLGKTVDGPRTDVNDITAYSYYAHDASCAADSTAGPDNFGCLGQLQSVTNALGQTTRYTRYNHHGQLEERIDANGLTATFTYDARQRLISRTMGTETTTYTRDALGQVVKIIAPDASFTHLSYDNTQRLISVADSFGNHIDYTLDALGHILKQDTYDANGQLTQSLSQQFDALNRQSARIGGQGQTTGYFYDANGNSIGATDPLNQSTAARYDNLNRLLDSVDAAGETTQISYDANGNRNAVTDPLNHQTQYVYDGLGNALSTDSPDTGVTQNSYDNAGNLTGSTDARGQIQSYLYDALNRVTQIRLPDQLATNFGYDQGSNGIGRLTLISENGGATATRWRYDAQGRVIGKTFKTGTLSLTTGYRYDSSGRLVAITYPSGKTVDICYEQGRVNALTSNTGALVSQIQYQPFAAPQSWLFGNGASAARSFDQDGRPVAYDLGDRSRVLSYDAAGRLLQDSTAVAQSQYSYDANGNRLQHINDSQTQSYRQAGDSNRLLGISVNMQTEKSYSYDAAGHLTSDGYNQFSYDSRGRLVKVSNTAIGNEQYRINGLGQRVAKVTGNAPDLSGDANQDGTLDGGDVRLIVLMVQGVRAADLAADCNHDQILTYADATCAQAKLADMKLNPGKYVQTGRYFVYDDAGHLLGEYDQTGKVLQETVWLGDMPVAVLTGNDRYFVYADHLNAPRAIGDATGKIIWRWDADAFGVTPANEDPDNDGNRFSYNLRFPGQYYDASAGLHYNGFRDYNPALGRYVQSDPIGLLGGINTYAYVGGNPVNYTDSSGLIIDTIVDVGFILYDLYKFASDSACERSANLTALGFDIVGAITPGVTGLGAASRVAAGPLFKATKEAALAASQLGFKRVNETVNGQAVFRNGNSYIIRDVDGHNGGAWKMADSVKELASKETRSGTFNADLTKRIGD